MKLSQWAKQQGVHYNTAYRWFYQGLIPNAIQLPTGTILIQNPTLSQDQNNDEVTIYCRVSSHNKKDDLLRQVERCQQFCLAKGLPIKKIIKEIASGTNDKRPKLIELLKSNPKHIVVEHKDRLTRFGFNYFQTLLPLLNCKITIINKTTKKKAT